MTGPGHYAKAEELLAQVDDGAADWQPLAAAAQVHATLALAAATAFEPAGLTVNHAEYRAWKDAAGVPADGQERNR